MNDYVGRHRDDDPRVMCTCTPVVSFALHRAAAVVKDVLEHHEPDCAITVERARRLHLTNQLANGKLPA